MGWPGEKQRHSLSAKRITTKSLSSRGQQKDKIIIKFDYAYMDINSYHSPGPVAEGSFTWRGEEYRFWSKPGDFDLTLKSGEQISQEERRVLYPKVQKAIKKAAERTTNIEMEVS